MDVVREKLAVVFLLVCWSSQVKAQGQGKINLHNCTILKCAVQNIYVY